MNAHIDTCMHHMYHNTQANTRGARRIIYKYTSMKASIFIIYLSIFREYMSNLHDSAGTVHAKLKYARHFCALPITSNILPSNRSSFFASLSTHECPFSSTFCVPM